MKALNPDLCPFLHTVFERHGRKSRRGVHLHAKCCGHPCGRPAPVFVVYKWPPPQCGSVPCNCFESSSFSYRAVLVTTISYDLLAITWVQAWLYPNGFGSKQLQEIRGDLVYSWHKKVSFFMTPNLSSKQCCFEKYPFLSNFQHQGSWIEH